MLSRIKVSYPDIRVALLEILDEKLSIENLKAIKQYVPTSDEVRFDRMQCNDAVKCCASPLRLDVCIRADVFRTFFWVF